MIASIFKILEFIIRVFFEWFLHHFEIFIPHSTYSHGIASKLHDELAVAVYTHDVSSLEKAREYTELNMFLGEFHEWIAKKSN